MSNQVAKKLHNPLTFSFPTIFQGRGVIVTIYGKEGHYGVLIDGDQFAQVKYESNYNSWFVEKGDLNDSDLVKEIGERIEAKLN